MIIFIQIEKRQLVIASAKDKVKLQVLSLLGTWESTLVRSRVNVWNRKIFAWNNPAKENRACTVPMPRAAHAVFENPPCDQWG